MKINLNLQLPPTVELPTSKSISARALIINALAGTPCVLHNLSDCDDTKAALRALTTHPQCVDIGAAGTAMRFLTAFYAHREGEKHLLTGTARMKQRPIRILVDALRSLGADISYTEAEGYPPLLIRGRRLKGGNITMAADVSSQYVSAVLMLAPTFPEGLTMQLEGEISSLPYIRMTLRLMEQFGAKTSFEGHTIQVAPGGYHRTDAYAVEPDWSAASYWYELVALCPDAEARVTLKGLQQDSLQGDSICAVYFSHLGVVSSFTDKGVVLTIDESFRQSRAPLHFDFTQCPDLAQTFVVTAIMQKRPFVFTGLKSLKIKETDRIAALITETEKLGASLQETAPGELSFDGHLYPIPSLPTSIATSAPSIATYEDHRMAMAFAPAAYLFPGLDIQNPTVVSKSYPQFWQHLPLSKKSQIRDN